MFADSTISNGNLSIDHDVFATWIRLGDAWVEVIDDGFSLEFHFDTIQHVRLYEDDKSVDSVARFL